jgi:release factor glutamine methyltransferase
MTVRELLSGSGLPDHEARRLLAHALGRRPASFTDLLVADDVAELYGSLVKRRLSGEPLQYIEGTVQFGPIELLADRRALVPRPETEELWEMVAAMLVDRSPEHIVDLCTGSGNLALALKHEFPHAVVHGTDTSSDALDLAASNGARLGLHVEWSHGDLFDALSPGLIGNVDVIVANPPYIAEREFADLPIDVRDHEPRAALVAGPTGDELLRRIAADATSWLKPGGLVACEIAATRATAAAILFSHYDAVVQADGAGRPRFVVGRSVSN